MSVTTPPPPGRECVDDGVACREAQERFSNTVKAAGNDLRSPEAWLNLENYLFTLSQARDSSETEVSLCQNCPLKKFLD